MSEIKNCPFCGGENTYIDEYEHEAGKRFRVTCLNCMGTVDSGICQQKAQAIAAWNTRTACFTAEEQEAIKEVLIMADIGRGEIF